MISKHIHDLLSKHDIDDYEEFEDDIYNIGITDYSFDYKRIEFKSNTEKILISLILSQCNIAVFNTAEDFLNHWLDKKPSRRLIANTKTKIN